MEESGKERGNSRTISKCQEATAVIKKGWVQKGRSKVLYKQFK